jgi:hypothetical protein
VFSFNPDIPQIHAMIAQDHVSQAHFEKKRRNDALLPGQGKFRTKHKDR